MQLSACRKKTDSWQEALSNVITDPKELFALLELSTKLLPEAYSSSRSFALRAPRSYISRIQKGNINDPLLMQILPLGIEFNHTSGYSEDPLHEAKANPLPGLLHKYHGRVLLTLTGACAIHCRYCFRRHFPYEENNPGKLGWEKIFAYIEQNDTISEVILSGGDPLVLPDHLLQSFTEQLAKIPHVKRLRIHTRLPVVLPERITKSFIEWIKYLRQQVVIVIHCNHFQEINQEVKDALLALHEARVSLLNQSVLLKGINDEVKTLAELSETLFASGVMPYYLHVLDKVQGAAHFDLPLERAKNLHAELLKTLPGYLVPHLVCEEPGALSKTWLSTALYTA